MPQHGSLDETRIGRNGQSGNAGRGGEVLGRAPEGVGGTAERVEAVQTPDRPERQRKKPWGGETESSMSDCSESECLRRTAGAGASGDVSKGRLQPLGSSRPTLGKKGGRKGGPQDTPARTSYGVNGKDNGLQSKERVQVGGPESGQKPSHKPEGGLGGRQKFLDSAE